MRLRKKENGASMSWQPVDRFNGWQIFHRKPQSYLAVCEKKRLIYLFEFASLKQVKKFLEERRRERGDV